MRPLHFVALLSAAAAAYATNCDSPDIFCSPMDGSCWNSLTNLYCNPSQGDSSCCVCVCGQRCVCVRRMGTDERARRAPCDPGVRILDKDGVCLDCPPSCAIVGVAGCVLAANRTTALCNCTAMGAVGSGGRVQLGPASCAAACTNRDYAMIFGVCERLCRPDTNVYGCGGHGICGYSDSGHDNCGCDAEWSGVGCSIHIVPSQPGVVLAPARNAHVLLPFVVRIAFPPRLRDAALVIANGLPALDPDQHAGDSTWFWYTDPVSGSRDVYATHGFNVPTSVRLVLNGSYFAGTTGAVTIPSDLLSLWRVQGVLDVSSGTGERLVLGAPTAAFHASPYYSVTLITTDAGADAPAVVVLTAFVVAECFGVDDGAGGCAPCAAGTTATGGVAGAGCAPCAPGWVAPYAGAARCTACPATTGAVAGAAAACDVCPVGTASLFVAQTYTCVPCASGTVALAPGAISCAACAPGTGWVAPSVNCTHCGAGTTLLEPTPGAGYVMCGTCPRGRAIVNGSCVPCGVGSFSDVEGARNCTACAPGSYAASPGATQCAPCPPGNFSQSPGAPFCGACSPGSYAGAAGAVTCTACPAGAYAPAAAATACLVCTSGSVAPTPRAESCSVCAIGSAAAAGAAAACVPCAAGTFAERAGALVCTPCGPGRFAAAPSAAACDVCPLGHVVTSNSSACVPCAAGTTGTGPGGACVACDPGTFSGAPGATACALCGAATYAAAPGASACTPCPPLSSPHVYDGSVRGLTTLAGCAESSLAAHCAAGSMLTTARECVVCGPGRYSTGVDSHACGACGDGQYSPGGATPCAAAPPGTHALAPAAAPTPCAAGTWSPSTGAAYCTPATAGTVISDIGATRDGVACAAGWLPAADAAACEPCAAGSTTRPVGPGGLPRCVLCATLAVGTVALAPGSPECVRCPAGLWANNPAGTACLPCPAGSGVRAAGEDCVPCPAGSYSGGDGVPCAYCDLGTGGLPGARTCDVCNASSVALAPPGAGAFATVNWTSLPATLHAGVWSCGGCPAGRVPTAPGVGPCVPLPPGYELLSPWVVASPCAAGRYQPTAGATGACAACGLGTWSAAIGARGPCTPCGLGNTTLAAGAASSAGCVGCPAGTAGAAGGRCVACAPGRFSASDGSTACAPCAPGTFASANGSLACVPCPPEFVASSAAATACVFCGTLAAGYGNAVCAPPCGAAAIRAAGGSCVPCGPNSAPAPPAAGVVDSAACAACAPWEAAPPGAAAGSCHPCTPGAVRSSSNSGGCVPCGAGWYGSRNGTVCSPCGTYTIASLPGATGCTLCPNFTLPNAAATSCVALPPCAPGLLRRDPRNATGCVRCPPNSALASGACAHCATGYVALGDTPCRACAAGSAPLSNGTCGTCAPGSHALPAASGCSVCASGSAAPRGARLCTPCGIEGVAAGGGACATPAPTPTPTSTPTPLGGGGGNRTATDAATEWPLVYAAAGGTACLAGVAWWVRRRRAAARGYDAVRTTPPLQSA